MTRQRALDGPAISPRMTAVFGALFGLATVTSVFALLIQVFPVREEQRLVATAGFELPSASARSTQPRPLPRKRLRVPLPGPWRLSALKSDPATRVVEGEIQQRSFIVALNEAGVPKAEAYRVLKAMDGVHKFDHPSKHDKFAVALTRPASKVVAFEYELSPIEIYQAREDATGLLKGARLDLQVGSEELSGAFYVGKNVERSAEVAGLEPGILGAIDKAFLGRISSEAFEEGGFVRAILVEQTALGLFVRYEHATVVEYRPPDPAQKPLRAYYFDGISYHGYVDERGRAPSELGWRSPIPGAPITSTFNLKRMHPVLRKVMPHQGTDYGAPMGAPVYAVFRGVVESVGMRGANGNLVVVSHPGGITTYYAHLSRYADGLKAGMRVGTHQLVGYVGSTGRSTGPHLHFGVKRNGQFIDSAELDMDAWRPLPAAERAAFLTVKQQLDARLEAIPLPEPIEEEPPAASASASSSASADATAPPESSAEPAMEPDEEPGMEPDEPAATATAKRAGASKDRPAKAGPTTSGGDLKGEDLSVPPE
jgi:murein DD-endopeptidase MepM/ murein hydrolase activator NlpD